MQAQTPEVSTEKAITERYDTIVIRGAQGITIPEIVDGGMVVAWSKGHDLAAMDALLEFIDDLAAGDCSYSAELTERAAQVLDLMERRRELGWDADKQSNKPVTETVTWSSVKPTTTGAYYVRNFRLGEDSNRPALIEIDYGQQGQLVCNIHDSNSNDDLQNWSYLDDLADSFEWLGPLSSKGGR
ncbi:hypothetical protein [Pseudomonas sp.]|uniref:hypothetical protein n=1 Tax=Pseudomonas sp. TaxID=306 RepID=UPI00257B9AAB|nr:hypothetical protein [Pseudomonas sp.]